MNYLDIVILIPVVWLGFIGFKKGLIIELATLLALVGGVFAALKFSNYASEILTDSVSSKYLPLVAFCATFIAVVVFVFLLGKLLEKAIKVIALGIVNRILGALFGVLKSLFVVGSLILIVEKINEYSEVVSKSDKNSSMLYVPLLESIHTILPAIEKTEVIKTILTP